MSIHEIITYYGWSIHNVKLPDKSFIGVTADHCTFVNYFLVPAVGKFEHCRGMIRSAEEVNQFFINCNKGDFSYICTFLNQFDANFS